MDATLVRRILRAVVFVMLVGWLLWSILVIIGSSEAQSVSVGRPIDAVIIHTTCDIYDEGGGMVTIYDGDGRIWKANPFELGAVAGSLSPESPE